MSQATKLLSISSFLSKSHYCHI